MLVALWNLARVKKKMRYWKDYPKLQILVSLEIFLVLS